MERAGRPRGSPPAPRLYLPRNFSCGACLYGSAAEPDKGAPDAVAAAAAAARPAAAREASGERRSPPRGREPCAPAAPRSPAQRRRAKSLPTPCERGLRPAPPPPSPARRKTVRFADSLGLELASVRHFCEADLPRVPALFEARGEPEPPPSPSPFFSPPFFSPPLEPLFPSRPGAAPGFLERVRRHKVRLEWVRSEPAGLRGAVRVLNVAYEKAVSVRYTLDAWASCAELPAAYLPPAPAGGDTDRFAFLLPLPAAAAALEFAVRYRVAGAEYWDNNGGGNYRLRERQRFPPAPPHDPDGSAWIHFI